MSPSWTEQQPGLGDVSGVEQLAVALRVFEDDLGGAAGEVDTAARTLSGSWRGQSAHAWEARASRVAAGVREIANPAGQAATALMDYAVSVRDIALRANAARDDLHDSQAAVRLAAAGYRELFRSGDAEPWQTRAAARRLDAAEEDLTGARTRLSRLAEERQSADALLVTRLRDLTPAGWGEYRALVAGLAPDALAGGTGWRDAFARWVVTLPDDATGAAALRWAVAQLTDEQVAELVGRCPMAAVLLMRPADLSGDRRFAGLAAAASGGGGLAQVAAVAAALAAMGRADQAMLVRLHPWLIGNLDGIPYPQRIAANRIAVAAALAQSRDREAELQARVATLEDALSGAPAFSDVQGLCPNPASPWDLAMARSELAAAAEQVTRYERLLTETIKVYDADGASVRLAGHQVVLFDPGQGRFAEVVGSLGPRTENIGVLVGGTGTNPASMSGEYAKAWGFVTKADPRGSLTMIAYLGGEMPQTLAFEAFDSRYANDLAAGLRDFAAGIDRPAGADVVVMGHSYGGSVVGAAEAAGMVVDRVVHVESAGAGPGVDGVQDYAAPDTPRYSMTAPGDAIEVAQGRHIGPVGHGADPDSLDGVVRLETGRVDHDDPRSELVSGLASHSGVFEKESTAWQNMLDVLTGRDVMLYQEPVVRTIEEEGILPGFETRTTVIDYPMADPDYEPPTRAVP